MRGRRGMGGERGTMGLRTRHAPGTVPRGETADLDRVLVAGFVLCCLGTVLGGLVLMALARTGILAQVHAFVLGS